SAHDARVIVSLVTTSAMLRRASDEAEPTDETDQAARIEMADAPPVSRSARFAAALERARKHIPDRPDPRSSGPPRASVEPLHGEVATPSRPARCAPSRSAPLALMLRRDASWLRAAAAVAQGEPAALGPQAVRVRDHLASAGASFLADLVSAID